MKNWLVVLTGWTLKITQNTILKAQSILSIDFQLIKNIQKDKLHSQFLNYQALSEDDLPEVIRDIIVSNEYGNCPVDILWDFIRDVKVPGTNSFQYDLLLKVTEVIMTITHSNAAEERKFSMINKNKTSFRSLLSLEGTLSAFMIVKTHTDDPLAWKPPQDLLMKAKKATMEYNREHSTASK